MMGQLNTSEMEELLAGQVVGRIGCHYDGKTYVVPISYAYDGQYIYCHAQPGMKVDMMRKNPKICFEVDQMRNMANWQSVISWGEFEELTDKALRNEALQKLAGRILPLVASETVKLSPDWPFATNDLAKVGGVVFRVRLEGKTGRFENNHVPMAFAT
ncbi:MAG: pyridoxamine 5'-phosphate oxidase family protein [Bacteroidota bacterium]|nr:pyridoxamine 5'-phosphate oxidase family protein [Bacteroidota bacterium]MDP4215622.1 pyridoxamine 5'-phosphate oxidase family protein [Bacteroidota bacterium]MDP4245603.1 pyridoxamine 5'-phosphate oxidase family protein [Bacteroidota bacterium]MDP4253673.1 pyridoxamine 5'-phosphate oxidase family protein [Bacteroidota bacterium]MDP4259569.1 pyridoxamine 5'-phosphate oxidase family protein [Bacteroidota bacterium]